MTISINTDVAGQFKIYTETLDGNLQLISESPNMIVDTGMHSVTAQTWADAFTRVLAGSGTNAPAYTDTFNSWSTSGELLLSATTTSLIPGSYTITDFLPGDVSTGPLSAGALYRLGRSWKITNTLGTSATISQLGTTNDTNTLFSKANVTPFVLSPSQFVYVVYELRLHTYTSTLTSNLSTTVPAGDPSTYNLGNNKFGIVNVPIAFNTVNPTTGVVTVNKAFTTGYGMYEPSTTDFYLYKQTQPYDQFTQKRNAFQANLLTTANTAGTAAPANTYAFYGLGNSKFEIEQPTYNGDFKIKRHIVVSPTGSTETIHGFLISNAQVVGTTVPTLLEQKGIHCVFNVPWTRPKDSFLKVYFEHNWGRL